MDDDAVLLSRKFVAGWEHSEEFEGPQAGQNVWPDQCCPQFKLRHRSFAPMKSCYFCQHADFHLNTPIALEVGVCYYGDAPLARTTI